MKIFFISLFVFALANYSTCLERSPIPTQPFRSIDHIAAFNFYRTHLKDKYCQWYNEYQYKKGTVKDGRFEPGSYEQGYQACIKTEADPAIPHMVTANLGPVQLSVPATIAAFRHARDMNQKHYFSHTGKDDSSTPKVRLERMGTFGPSSLSNENIGYSTQVYSPLLWITKYHIDDGIPNRGHRKNLIAATTHSGIAEYQADSMLPAHNQNTLRSYVYHVMNGVSGYTRGAGCDAGAVAEVVVEDAEEGQTGVPTRYGNIDDGVDAAGNVKAAEAAAPAPAPAPAPASTPAGTYESNFQDAPGATVSCHKTYVAAIADKVVNKTATPTGKTCAGEHPCDFKGFASTPTQCNFDVFCCMSGQLLRAINHVPPM